MFGILNSLFGGTSGETRRGMNYLNQSGQAANNAYRMLLEDYQKGQALGRYNADAQVQQAIAESQQALNMEQGNTLTRLRSLGFRPGDSPTTQIPRRQSEEAQLALQRNILDARTMQEERRMRDLQALTGAGFNLSGSLGNLGQTFYGIGAQRDAQNQNALGSLISLGSLFGPRSTPRTKSPSDFIKGFTI